MPMQPTSGVANMPGNGKRGTPSARAESKRSLEHLERWEPIETDINCRTCGMTCNEKLNEYSLLTTYRCPQGHKNFRI